MSDAKQISVDVIAVRFSNGVALCRYRGFNWGDQDHPGDLAARHAGFSEGVMLSLPPRVRGTTLVLTWVVIGDGNIGAPGVAFELTPAEQPAPRFTAATRERVHPTMPQLARRALCDAAGRAGEDAVFARELANAGFTEPELWR